jgi:hypothetical protein
MRPRAPRVKTSVIKQPAGLCRSNEFRSIFRNAKDFVGRDLVFLRLSQRQEFGSTEGARSPPSADDLGQSADNASRTKPMDFMAFRDVKT